MFSIIKKIKSLYLKKKTDSNFVIILGMHRSGTSCLAGMLSSYGLYMGDVSLKNDFNSKGNQENIKVRKINNALLGFNESSWRNPSQATKNPPRLLNKVDKHISKMKITGKTWGIKDPRMLFTLSMWLRPSTILVGTFRHPLSVARSLEERGKKNKKVKISLNDGLKLWFMYNSELLKLYQKNPFPIVRFDWAPERYQDAVRSIARHLSLENKGESFFDDNLRQPPCLGEIPDPEHRELYKKLIAIAEGEERKIHKSHVKEAS